MARSGEGGGAAACSGGVGGGEDEGVRAEWRPGRRAARWHGARAGMAASTAAALSGTTALGDVGLARRGSGRRRRRRRCSGTWARAVGGAGDGGGTKRNKCLGEGRRREEGNIWGGLLSRVKPPPGTKDHPGQKGVFGRAGKIPSPRPTFSPGWIYHRGQKGPVFPRSRLMLCLFLFLFTSLLKLAFIC